MGSAFFGSGDYSAFIKKLRKNWENNGQQKNYEISKKQSHIDKKSKI